MSESIFEGETKPEVPPAPITPVTPTLQIPPELADLVGEGKKYSTVEAALKSVAPAQTHISTIESENARLKAELEARKTTEQLLEELRGNPPSEQRQAVTQELPDVEKLVEQALSRKAAQTISKQNTMQVVSAFQETFGDKAKAEEMYVKLAQENGMSVEFLNNMAAHSPHAVLKLAGITKTQESVPQGKPHSSVNTQALNQNNGEVITSKVALVGASTKDVVSAWKKAGEIVNKKLNQG
jgi:hypothetical protein